MRSRHERPGAYVGGHRQAAAPPVVPARLRRRERRPRRRTWRAALVSLIVTMVVIGAAAGAQAYWHATGVGAGAATTGTAAVLTITPGTPTASLYPGGSADVALVLSNPNSTAVTLASLTLATTQGTGGFAVDAGHSGCATTSLSYTTQRNSGAGWSVPARTGTTDGSLALSLPDAVAMDVGAADACQGATFTVYLMAGS